MTTTTTKRVQQIDEAKEVIAELEDRKGMKLSGPRGALLSAAETIDYDQMYDENFGKAMATTAGLAIEAGHDDLAAEAANLASVVSDELSIDN